MNDIASVGYVCPRNVLQCTAAQCMCYKDIQMKEGTFKRKIDIHSSYSTKSIFYLSITTTERLYLKKYLISYTVEENMHTM